MPVWLVGYDYSLSSLCGCLHIQPGTTSLDFSSPSIPEKEQS